MQRDFTEDERAAGSRREICVRCWYRLWQVRRGQRLPNKCFGENERGIWLTPERKNHYDETSQTQFSPSIYELYNGAELLQSESMDFQTHLYRYGEMEAYLIERLNPELNKKKEPLHLLENLSSVLIQNFSEENAFMKDFFVW